MPKEVFKFTKKNCKKNSKVGLLATEGTLKTGVYDKIFNKDFNLIQPSENIQKKSVNKAGNILKWKVNIFTIIVFGLIIVLAQFIEWLFKAISWVFWKIFPFTH